MATFVDLLPGVGVTTVQRGAAGDAVALVVLQIPPTSTLDADRIDVEVLAEFDNNVRHSLGKITLHPRPRAGARVVATACVPGARCYHALWSLDSSRGLPIQVGLHTSIGGAGRFGLVNLDLLDDESSESTWTNGLGYGTQQLVTPSAGVLAELWGHNRTADSLIQVHDSTLVSTGDTPIDEFHVPAGGTFFRSYPPLVLRRGLVVARSTTAGSYTANPSGDQAARARLLVR